MKWLSDWGGGGVTVNDLIEGGAQDTFSYELFIILKILGGHMPPWPPIPKFKIPVDILQR